MTGSKMKAKNYNPGELLRPGWVSTARCSGKKMDQLSSKCTRPVMISDETHLYYYFHSCLCRRIPECVGINPFCGLLDA